MCENLQQSKAELEDEAARAAPQDPPWAWRGRWKVMISVTVFYKLHSQTEHR